MRYRKLGSTDLSMSEIGVRVGPIVQRLDREMDEAEAQRIFFRALDLGITLFDTSDWERDGRGEEFLAKSLRKQRDAMVISAKVGYEFEALSWVRGVEPMPPQNFSTEHVRRATERSLRRLKTDRIDLLQLHDIGLDQVSDEELWQTLRDLQKEGKIRYFGATIGPELGWMFAGLDCIRERQPAVFQHQYNIVEHYPGSHLHGAVYLGRDSDRITSDNLPRLQHGLMDSEPIVPTRFLIVDPIPAPPARVFEAGADVDSNEAAKLQSVAEERYERKVRALQFLTGAETGRTFAQAALLWLLAEQTVAACLPTIYNEAQLHEFASLGEKNPLTHDELERVAEMQRENFGVKEPNRVYAGTMRRDS